MIHLVTTAYGLSMGTRHVVETALQAGCHVHLFLHSRQPDVLATCQDLSERAHVSGYLYGVNRGLAKSWNEGLVNAFQDGAETVILVNDDYTFTPRDLDTLITLALKRQDLYAVTAYGSVDVWGRVAPIGVAFQAMNPLSLEALGCFDENYFPIYYEDIDYQRRATLLGLEVDICYDMTVGRLSQVSTVDMEPRLHQQNAVTQTLNKAYHIQKWGGDRGEEEYLTPFNDPALGLRIDPAHRHAPYGAYDRTDQGIVFL